jgi:uncharacterized protein YegP (UPF0339 family)
MNKTCPNCGAKQFGQTKKGETEYECWSIESADGKTLTQSELCARCQMPRRRRKTKIEIRYGGGGAWYWKLRMKNGNIKAESVACYSSKAACKRGCMNTAKTMMRLFKTGNIEYPIK